MDTLRLPAVLDSLGPIRTFLEERAAAAGLGPEDFPKVDLVLEEVLTNQIRHAYRGGKWDVEVSCLADEAGTFCVSFVDWGPPFDPLRQPPPDLGAPLEERPIGGLGIHLVRKMTDSIVYRRDGGRNVLKACFRAGQPKG